MYQNWMTTVLLLLCQLFLFDIQTLLHTILTQPRLKILTFLLKNCAAEIAPILEIILKQSLNQKLNIANCKYLPCFQER